MKLEPLTNLRSKTSQLQLLWYFIIMSTTSTRGCLHGWPLGLTISIKQTFRVCPLAFTTACYQCHCRRDRGSNWACLARSLVNAYWILRWIGACSWAQHFWVPPACLAWHKTPPHVPGAELLCPSLLLYGCEIWLPSIHWSHSLNTNSLKLQNLSLLHPRHPLVCLSVQ